jgi:hypothetical protein
MTTRNFETKLNCGIFGECTATVAYYPDGKDLAWILLHKPDCKTFEIEAEWDWLTPDAQVAVMVDIQRDAIEQQAAADDFAYQYRSDRDYFERECA